MFSPKVVQPNAWSHKAALVFGCIFFHPSLEKEFESSCFFLFHNPSSDSLITRLFVCLPFPPSLFPPKAVSSFSFSPRPTTAARAIRTLVSRPGGKFKEGGKKKKRKKQVPPYIFNHLLTFPFPMYSLNS